MSVQASPRVCPGIRSASDRCSDTLLGELGELAQANGGVAREVRPDAPQELRQSAEADVAPKHAVDKIDLIDAILGEDSQFHRQHGSRCMAYRSQPQCYPPDGRIEPSVCRRTHASSSVGV
jgi:hypothetical protein